MLCRVITQMGKFNNVSYRGISISQRIVSNGNPKILHSKAISSVKLSKRIHAEDLHSVTGRTHLELDARGVWKGSTALIGISPCHGRII